jgi:opacity protein-like surface antigen
MQIRTMTSTVRTLVLAATLAGTFSTTAAAQMDDPIQRSNTAGFNLGLFLNGSAAQVEDADETDSGAGLSLHAGYGFTPNVGVFARLSAAAIQAEGFEDDQYALAHFDLGLRYSFGSTASPVRPYLSGAVSGRAASFDLGSEGMLDVRGSGFTAGGGLEYFVQPNLAIEGGLSFSFGEFNEGRLDGSEWVDLDDEALDMNTTRFDLGVSWHP